MARRIQEGEQWNVRLISRQIQENLQEDRQHWAEDPETAVKSLLVSNPPLEKYVWIRIQGWYKEVFNPPPPPSANQKDHRAHDGGEGWDLSPRLSTGPYHPIGSDPIYHWRLFTWWRWGLWDSKTSPTEPLRGTIGYTGGTPPQVACEGNTWDGARWHPLEEGVGACKGSFPQWYYCWRVHVKDGGADCERAQKVIQGDWTCGYIIEDQHGYHQFGTHFGDRVPLHAAWILGMARDRNHHIWGQDYPTANSNKGGGPLWYITGSSKGVRPPRQIQLPWNPGWIQHRTQYAPAYLDILGTAPDSGKIWGWLCPYFQGIPRGDPRRPYLLQNIQHGRGSHHHTMGDGSVSNGGVKIGTWRDGAGAGGVLIRW